MTQKERFIKTASFNDPDRAFLLAPWYWNETMERWIIEGLPKDANLCEFFQTDEEQDVPFKFNGPYGPYLYPPFEVKIISETEEYTIECDRDGNTLKLFKDVERTAMPQWLSYAMKTREDWKRDIKPRFDAKNSDRIPTGAEWQSFVKKAAQRDYPLGIWCGSFYGWPRSLMGVETLSLMFYEDPKLVHEMCEHIADFFIESVTPILKEVSLDFAFIWEDMACKAGPLCSPVMYKEFMSKPLKRIVEMLHKHNVYHIIIDSDGNNDVMIPLWLECGITGLRPYEMAAGCDPIKDRRLYGRNLIIQGGIDKRALSTTKEAIDREILSKVPWLCMQGGYFPQIDHLTPPDISLDNYIYYSKLMRSVVEDPERYFDEAKKRGFWN